MYMHTDIKRVDGLYLINSSDSQVALGLPKSTLIKPEIVARATDPMPTGIHDTSHYESLESVHQGCTNRGPRAGSGPRTCYIRPSEQFQKYKKLILNKEDIMNEFKFHSTVNNYFATYSLLQSEAALMARISNYNQ